MRIRLALTLDVRRGAPPEPYERESSLDAITERADPHPEVDRPIGFRRDDS